MNVCVSHHGSGIPNSYGPAQISFSLTDGQTRIKAIAFGQADQLEPLREHRQCRVAYEPILNTFNGRTSVEMQVIDIALV